MKALLETAEGFTKIIEIDDFHNIIRIVRMPKFRAKVTQEEIVTMQSEIEEIEFYLQCRTADFGYYVAST